MTIRAVSFDLDGTLAEVKNRKFRMWPQFLRHPRVLTAWLAAVEAHRNGRDLNLDNQIAHAIALELKIAHTEVEAILSRTIGDYWPGLFKNARTMPSVLTLITEIDRSQIPRAVVSDHPALKKLNLMGLDGWSSIISCRRLGALKPNPDGLWAAAAQMGVSPSELLHVGDRWDTDGAAAAVAGCAFLHIDEIGDSPPIRFKRKGPST